LYAYLISM